MPRRNRVSPFGDIEASPARGRFMGNRGILHDEHGAMGPRSWRHKNWIICQLSFKGVRRALMAPNRYTELFFLDEAVALAAGHRPCAECRREHYRRFLAAWRAGHALAADAPLDARAVDAALHRARLQGNSQRATDAVLGNVPDGAFVSLPSAADQPMLRWAGLLHPWTHDGYGDPRPVPGAAAVRLLTPLPTVAVLRGGYVPAVAL